MFGMSKNNETNQLLVQMMTQQQQMAAMMQQAITAMQANVQPTTTDAVEEIITTDTITLSQEQLAALLQQVSQCAVPAATEEVNAWDVAMSKTVEAGEYMQAGLSNTVNAIGEGIGYAGDVVRDAGNNLAAWIKSW